MLTIKLVQFSVWNKESIILTPHEVYNKVYKASRDS